MYTVFILCKKYDYLIVCSLVYLTTGLMLLDQNLNKAHYELPLFLEQNASPLFYKPKTNTIYLNRLGSISYSNLCSFGSLIQKKQTLQS